VTALMSLQREFSTQGYDTAHGTEQDYTNKKNHHGHHEVRK